MRTALFFSSSWGLPGAGFALTSAGGLGIARPGTHADWRPLAVVGPARPRAAAGGVGRRRGDATVSLSTAIALQRCPAASCLRLPAREQGQARSSAVDLLDPEGWVMGMPPSCSAMHDGRCAAAHRGRKPSLRFNGRHGARSTHAELCARLGWSPRSVRDTILLCSILRRPTRRRSK